MPLYVLHSYNISSFGKYKEIWTRVAIWRVIYTPWLWGWVVLTQWSLILKPGETL